MVQPASQCAEILRAQLRRHRLHCRNHFIQQLCPPAQELLVGLRYEADQRPLTGMSDSDWAVQHSTTGWVFTYCRAAISWSSKKQQTIALSSCEAEIVALTDAAKEAISMENFLRDLGMSDGSATAVSTDNTGAQALSYNPEFHDRTIA